MCRACISCSYKFRIMQLRWICTPFFVLLLHRKYTWKAEHLIWTVSAVVDTIALLPLVYALSIVTGELPWPAGCYNNRKWLNSEIETKAKVGLHFKRDRYQPKAGRSPNPRRHWKSGHDMMSLKCTQGKLNNYWDYCDIIALSWCGLQKDWLQNIISHSCSHWPGGLVPRWFMVHGIPHREGFSFLGIAFQIQQMYSLTWHINKLVWDLEATVAQIIISYELNKHVVGIRFKRLWQGVPTCSVQQMSCISLLAIIDRNIIITTQRVPLHR